MDARFLAYKDEYEVARLLTDPMLVAKAPSQGSHRTALDIPAAPSGAAGDGPEKEDRLGSGAPPCRQGARRGKKLRGTRLDPFGYAHVRRVERALLAALRSHGHSTCRQPHRRQLRDGSRRGCRSRPGSWVPEDVKLGNVLRYRETLAALTLPASVPDFPITAEELPPRQPEARPGSSSRSGRTGTALQQEELDRTWSSADP